MRNSFQKRVLPLILTVCMILAMIPAAFAAGGRFTDVDEKNWASPYIRDVVEKGLMNGISETEFAPQGTLTRGMIATILSRMAEAKVDNSAKTPFADVDLNRYYTGAIAWAAENGLVKGYPDGTFRPANPVTRQEVATLVFRYAEYAQLTLPGNRGKAEVYRQRQHFQVCQRAGGGHADGRHPVRLSGRLVPSPEQHHPRRSGEDSERVPVRGSAA